MNVKHKGRAPGARGKAGRQIDEMAVQMNVNPFKILLLFASGDWEALGLKSETVTVHLPGGAINEEWSIPVALRLKAASEAAAYLYPKLKSVESKVETKVVESTKYSEMTDEELDRQ